MLLSEIPSPNKKRDTQITWGPLSTKQSWKERCKDD
jgi:hypothetical protein